MKRLSLTIIALCLLGTVFSQTGYRIDFKIKNWKDTTVYLGSYNGETTILKDTAQVKAGAFHFDGKKPLPEGIYYLVLAKNKLFDFVVGKNQTFSIETHSTDYLKVDEYLKNLMVKGDADNQLYFENLHFIGERSVEAEPLIKILRDSTITEDQKKPTRESFSKINDKVLPAC
jgi:hypothetical protein